MIQQKIERKKTCFNADFLYSQPKIKDKNGLYSSNKMWSLKSLTNLKCEGRTSLHAA